MDKVTLDADLAKRLSETFPDKPIKDEDERFICGTWKNIIASAERGQRRLTFWPSTKDIEKLDSIIERFRTAGFDVELKTTEAGFMKGQTEIEINW